MVEPNLDQLKDMNAMLEGVDPDIAVRAQQAIQEAHATLTAAISDLNDRHIAATDDKGGTIGWASAQRSAQGINRQNRKVRENAAEELEHALSRIGVPEENQERITNYLSRIIVASGRVR